MTLALSIAASSNGTPMTAVVIPLPIRPNPNSLTQRDLGEITAESRALPGPWVIEVATDCDESDRPDEVSAYLFLRRVSDTEPCFIIRRVRDMIRVTARDDSAAGIKASATLGDFQTMAAAFSAIGHDVSVMAMQWDIEPKITCATAGHAGALSRIIGKGRFGTPRARLKVIEGAGDHLSSRSFRAVVPGAPAAPPVGRLPTRGGLKKLSDLIQEAGAEVLGLLGRRFSEGMNELKSLMRRVRSKPGS
jgi:hypothetical protein